MKTLIYSVCVVLVFPGALAAGARPASCEAGGCQLAVADGGPLVLSAQAGEALRLQIEEERMAGELYRAWGKQWPLPPFANIPQAEARHAAALQQLAARAGIAIPTAQPGRFATAEIQRRYDALLAQGLVSLPEALRTAALVEEQDIADLRVLMTRSDAPALRALATQLAQASGHHLAAFASQLSRRENSLYQAQILPAAEVEALIKASAGGGGCGSGRGIRCAR